MTRGSGAMRGGGRSGYGRHVASAEDKSGDDERAHVGEDGVY